MEESEAMKACYEVVVVVVTDGEMGGEGRRGEEDVRGEIRKVTSNTLQPEVKCTVDGL